MKVSIDHQGEGGSVTVSYKTLEELDELCSKLGVCGFLIKLCNQSFSSTASQISASRLTPSNWFTDCKPVGDVTLISVSQSPMTSMPTKVKTAFFQVWPDCVANKLFAVGQCRFNCCAASNKVGPYLTLCRHPVNGTNRFAVDQDDAFVAGLLLQAKTFAPITGSRDASRNISSRLPRFESPSFR